MPIESVQSVAENMLFKSNRKAHLQASDTARSVWLTDKIMIRFDYGIVKQCKLLTLSS